MAPQPGLIIFLGSGETAPSIRAVYHWLFERLERDIHLGILETPAGFEPNSAGVAHQIADFMEKRLQNFHPRLSIIPARKRGTAFSPDDPAILTPLLACNVIMMGPGSPTYAARQLQDSAAWHTLAARHRLGASLIFASAATIASGFQALPVYEIYKVGEDLHWKPGLNLLAAFGLSVVFIPHWNNNDGGTELDTSHCYIGTGRYDRLVEMLPGRPTIVGIDEHTALVLDPVAGTGQVMGRGDVRIIRAGQEQHVPNSQTFELTDLGPFRLPDPQAFIPDEVWRRVQAAQAEADRKEEPQPSSKVLSLVKARSTARSRQDWTTADTLRDEIEAMGWKVIDTPEGPFLETA